MTHYSQSIHGPGFREDQQGIALLSILMLMLILTVLGIAAMTITGLENRVAGFASSMEASSAAADSCVATGVKVIQQVLDLSNGMSVPAALLDNQTPPGPVPNGNKAQLENEIAGDPTAVRRRADRTAVPTGIAAAVPNLVQTVGAYSVAGDIDMLYKKAAGWDGPAVRRCL